MGKESRCVNCGVDIEKDYILFINGTEFTFDSFECALNFVAPRCTNCNSIVMGKGIRRDGDVYCSKSCSQQISHAQIVP